MARYQAVRGTFDVLPNEVPRWQQLENTARELANRFGFREIRTPLFEQAELYTKGMGVMSGLIEKELWTFKDKYGQKLALRADLTTGVVRAYQQNKLFEATRPQKMFYLGSVFLLGKEGKDRSRQSHQFGFEALGSDNAALDAEVIALASSFCNTVGLEGHSIRLNSLGGADCRPLYLQKLKEYFGSNSEQLCSTCKRKYKAHPDWVLSCEEDSCKGLSQVAPTIFGMLSNGAKAHFTQLREYLQEMELPVELDPRVVRDSEYYNRTVFEIRCGGRSVGFGGRYDTLVEKLGGKSTPAVGFAISLEAVIDLLGDEQDTEGHAPFVFFQPEGPESSKLLVPLMNTLRQRGVSAELDYRTNHRRPQAPPDGCSYCVILDESNAFRGHAILKSTDNSKDEKIPVQRLRNRILHLVGVSAEAEKDGAQSGRKRLRRGRRKPDEDNSGSNDSKRDQNNNEDRGESQKRSRRSRRGRDSDDEQKDAENRKESSGREKKSRARQERSARKEKPRRAARSKEAEDDGKAIVPAFNLGGVGLAAAAPAKEKAKAKSKAKAKVKKAKAKTKAKAKSKAKAKAKAKTKTKVKAAAKAGSAGGLNWSILPGKDNGKSEGSDS